MKKKIIFKDKVHNKIIEEEVIIRDLDHFEAQLKNKHKIFRTKKGKGSYTRKEKHKNLEK